MSKADDAERFMSYVKKTAGCWIWMGSVGKQGYGSFYMNHRGMSAQRASYRLFIGEVEDSKIHVDHICFNPPCVRPSHLRLLTASENTRRQRSAFKRFCIHGHEFTPENTLPKSASTSGVRSCRACGQAAQLRYLARKKLTKQEHRE